ncbi:hypothetical protein CERSUDRAFT_163378 [Gelatoporia subvermispora B]|uniref:Essential protein Yae1 N-terminal domain-containing protein n=1 Tax=Ceriporiopsis subvermispora (strain B) TaxID=914234 RepID=M2QGM1_CERS8|nr:hypothetical protein CERSUDRAFT_163378 [Gelatoporia subvermispora B]
MDFDLEDLVHVEQTFYEHGYADGHAHGRVHGLIEGRALGREKGFEMWEELGFYEGFASMWQAIHSSQSGPDDRTTHHTKQLLELIAQFPRINPSATDASDLDIPKLFRQIRSRYKALCATLGVRPTLRSGVSSSPTRQTDDPAEAPEGTRPDASRKVWPVQAAENQRPREDLNF